MRLKKIYTLSLNFRFYLKIPLPIEKEPFDPSSEQDRVFKGKMTHTSSKIDSSAPLNS